MTTIYPDSDYLKGNYAPLRMECDASDLIVEGELPKDLHGAFFRTGPNPQYPPLGEYHWFSGDGMIHAFYFEDGRVSYKNRWVRTAKWKLESKAGRSLFSAYNSTPNDPSVEGLLTDGRANVNILPFGERLLAFESSHPPINIDPRSLATGTQETFQGGLRGAAAPHPKIDPETGELLMFAHNAKGRLSSDMSFHIVNAAGKVTRSEFFLAPYAALVHDFVTTRNYAVFPIMPLAGSLERAARGESAYAWEPERGNHIGILPRNGSIDEMRWFRGEEGYVYHILNGYEDGNMLICDVFEFDEAPLFPRADRKPSDRERWVPRLFRWHFDLTGQTDSYKREQLDDVPCEFGRLDDRRAGLSYRYGYFGVDTIHNWRTGQFNGIARRDNLAGVTSKYESTDNCIFEEPIYVPRSNKAPEGEGYVISMMYNPASNTSSLTVTDAENISDGPIAKVRMDHRVPFGFHGNWCCNLESRN